MNGSSLGLSFAPRGVVSNSSLCQTTKPFDHSNISGSPRWQEGYGQLHFFFMMHRNASSAPSTCQKDPLRSDCFSGPSESEQPRGAIQLPEFSLLSTSIESTLLRYRLDT
ncbi:hypothetical protein Tco_0614057 [Tanacetum coccineum]